MWFSTHRAMAQFRTRRYPWRVSVLNPDIETQCANCFHNIDRALAEAGASLAELVRVLIFVAREADFDKVAPIIRKHCYAARPTNTLVFARMVSPDMLIEIEATAKIRR
jgi:enamine deaminase RidA (YjgF/YER057c/UK114 family)